MLCTVYRSLPDAPPTDSPSRRLSRTADRARTCRRGRRRAAHPPAPPPAPSGRIVSAFAEFERDRIGERIRQTKRQQKARGEYLGGPPPFGWAHDAERRLVPVPEQQKAIRWIQKLAAEGLSPYKISDDLKARGVKLSHVTIRKIAGRRIAA
jgi:hypothetical protein